MFSDIIHHLFKAGGVVVIISAVIAGKIAAGGKFAVIAGSFPIQNKEYGLADIGDAVHQVH